MRYVLCDGAAKVRRQDGSETEAAVLIPSAFFVIEPISGNEGAIDVVPEEKIEKETKTEDGKVTGSVVGYRLIGGGYGHGVGMSQNGAARMADGGRKAEEILTFFYEGGRLLNLYETGGDGQ